MREKVEKNQVLARELASKILGGFKVEKQGEVIQIMSYFSEKPHLIQLYGVCFSHGDTIEKLVLATHASKGNVHVFLLKGTVDSIERDYRGKVPVCTFGLHAEKGVFWCCGFHDKIYISRFSSKSVKLFNRIQEVLFTKSIELCEKRKKEVFV